MELKIREARERAGYTQSELASLIGVAPNTFCGYENGLHDPKSKLLRKIAKECNTTIDYLLGLTDEPNRNPVSPSSSVSRSEMEGIKKYRALDEHGKELVSLVLDKEYERVTMEDDDFNEVPFRISEQPAAAGLGVYLGPEMFRTVMVRADALPRKAAFGVPVSGDSMEPDYHDGDILIVSTDKPALGEVGIYTMDGQGYVKVRGNDELISLNPAYAPILMTEDIICNGKVIGVLGENDVQN